MSYSIFIKTWKDDVKWLPYTLQSIKKYAVGNNEIVIVADRSCAVDVKTLDEVAGFAKVVVVEDWENGYIQQQWIKLNADTIVKQDSDYVLFVDSDCIFHTTFSEQSFMRDRKPVLLKTAYGSLGGAEAWKSITEEFVGFPVNYEYMRRLPWMYRTSSLTAFKNKYPNTFNYLSNLQSRDFSEFNALGAYIEKYESDKYCVSDTEVWLPNAVAKQYWSWGGITPEIQAEINSFLSGGVA
jgi:hypothetical protein